ncbi:hypothetical protein BH23GEM11_BH23GEM11_14400 [soil metagenome]
MSRILPTSVRRPFPVPAVLSLALLATLLATLFGVPDRASAQLLQTPAEQNGYQAISSYEEMVDFYFALGARAEAVRIREF